MPATDVLTDVSQCATCVHRRSWFVTGDRTVCDAFPGGIPAALWHNEVDHRGPAPNDHGIRWESDGGQFPDWAFDSGERTGVAMYARASDPKRPYGDVKYADPGYQPDGVKRYPIDTEDHVRAAWSYINQAKNAAKYTAEQLAAIKRRIKAAGKRFGIEFADDDSERGYTPRHARLATLLVDVVMDGRYTGEQVQARERWLAANGGRHTPDREREFNPNQARWPARTPHIGKIGPGRWMHLGDLLPVLDSDASPDDKRRLLNVLTKTQLSEVVKASGTKVAKSAKKATIIDRIVEGPGPKKAPAKKAAKKTAAKKATPAKAQTPAIDESVPPTRDPEGASEGSASGGFPSELPSFLPESWSNRWAEASDVEKRKMLQEAIHFRSRSLREMREENDARRRFLQSLPEWDPRRVTTSDDIARAQREIDFAQGQVDELNAILAAAGDAGMEALPQPPRPTDEERAADRAAFNAQRVAFLSGRLNDIEATVSVGEETGGYGPTTDKSGLLRRLRQMQDEAANLDDPAFADRVADLIARAEKVPNVHERLAAQAAELRQFHVERTDALLESLRNRYGDHGPTRDILDRLKANGWLYVDSNPGPSFVFESPDGSKGVTIMLPFRQGQRVRFSPRTGASTVKALRDYIGPPSPAGSDKERAEGLLKSQKVGDLRRLATALNVQLPADARTKSQVIAAMLQQMETDLRNRGDAESRRKGITGLIQDGLRDIARPAGAGDVDTAVEALQRGDVTEGEALRILAGDTGLTSAKLRKVAERLGIEIPEGMRSKTSMRLHIAEELARRTGATAAARGWEPTARDYARFVAAYTRADVSPRDRLKHYWTKGKGLAKWATRPHGRWTALYRHLKKHMPNEMAKRVAAQWFHEVFGYWPGHQKGKNPVGPG